MRLIDADALLDRIPNLYERREVARWVDEAPTIEPDPEKYGKWLKEDHGHVEYTAVCSECGYQTFWSDRSNYCPYCGSDMQENDHDAQRWISCDERMPEDDSDVLVTDGEDCAVAYWRTDAQAWDDCMHGWCDLYGLDVIAWMPLPAPYERGKNGET